MCSLKGKGHVYVNTIYLWVISRDKNLLLADSTQKLSCFSHKRMVLSLGDTSVDFHEKTSPGQVALTSRRLFLGGVSGGARP